MNHYDPTDAQLREWNQWLNGRPQVIQDLAARFPPWKLFRLKDSGHRVVPYSFNEDGTLTVTVLGKFNFVAFDRNVFGIDPADLDECDLPLPTETLCTASRIIAEATGRDEEEVVNEIVATHQQRHASERT